MNILKLLNLSGSRNSSAHHRDEHAGSRKLFMLENTVSSSTYNLTSGAFLVGYAAYIGANDQFNGIIAGVPALAGVVQILSPLAFERKIRRKPLIVAITLIYKLILGMMLFIPLLVQEKQARLALLFSMYLAAFLLSSFVTPAANNWLISLVPGSIRGKFFGRRDSYTLAFVTIVNLLMGRVLDCFKLEGKTYTGFVVLFCVVILFTAGDFILLLRIKEPALVENNVPLDLISLVTVPFKDRTFRKVIILFILWNIGQQVGGTFFGVYLVAGLKLKYSYIMLLSTISNVMSVLTVRLWGKTADRKSWIFTTKFSIGILALTEGAWFFVNGGNAFLLVPLLHVMGGIAWAGINISLFNIQFQFSPAEGRTVYLGFNAALGGIIGFMATLAGSFIVNSLEGKGFRLLGFETSNIQVVFGLSGAILLLCCIFVHGAFSKELSQK